MRIYSVELEHMDDYSQPEAKYMYGSPVVGFTRTVKEANKLRTKMKRLGMVCKVYPIDIDRNKNSIITILQEYVAQD